MKKHLLFGLLSVLASQTMMADPIDLEQAKKLAAPFMQNTAEVSLVKKAVRSESKSRTLAADVKATAPYYIFSRGENQGYVIVSGDDCLPKILGYTESGDFDEEKMPPHLLSWLEYYGSLVEEAQAQGVNAARTEAKVTRATKESVAPLMTTHWNQGWPYNNFCPYRTDDPNSRSLTGCVATAAAQVVYYWRKDNPSTLLSTTPTYGYGAPVTVSYPAGTPMKWDLMLDDYNSPSPQEYKDAVAIFNAALGHATWLTYGSSTSGQISNLVHTFNAYFRISSVCEYKSGDQTGWENKIYNDLIAGRPIVYSGVHPSQGGHAIVLDGYNAGNNLYHFNFGWGGQGDGYYTVDDQTGAVNGFYQQQGMTYQIQPKQRNISVDIVRPADFYVNTTNDIRVKVTNNSTLPFSGVYLFMNTTGSKPSSLNSAKSEDETTVFAADGTTNYVTLSCKPTQAKDCYIWVTDEKLNVLAKDTIGATIPQSNLELYAIDLNGSADVQTLENEDYTIIYNDKATCEVEIGNAGKIDYEASPRLALYGSADNGKTFEYVGYKSGKLAVKAGERTRFDVNITNTTTCPVEFGKPYYVVLVNPIASTAADDTVTYVTTDTIARFILAEPTLAVESFENGCVKMTGKWDYNEFKTLANRAAYKTATMFDLTAVEGIGSAPVCDKNPNALFLVADDVNVAGNNIVKSDGTATMLSLTAGYDFTATMAIKADKAEVNIAQDPNHWYLFTAPCALSVPNGIIARQIDSHSKSGISNKTTNVTSLEAGKTYLVMTSSSRKQILAGENIVTATTLAENADPAVVGTFVSATAPVGSFVISHVDEYFEPQEAEVVVDGLRGYFNDSEVTRRFRAYSSVLLDPKYQILGQSIEAAYDILEENAKLVTDEAYEAMVDSIAAAEKVFSEQSITTGAKVEDYAEALLALTEEYKSQIKVDDEEETEVDMTSLIVNPSFETGTLSGWTAEDNTIAKVRNNSDLNFKGVGCDGAKLLCNLSTDSLGVKISQTVSGLVPGTYRLTAMLGTDLGNTVTMFAGDLQTTVDAHDFGKFYLREARIDNVKVGKDGTLEIGVDAGDWYKADNFRLTLLEADEENVPDAIEKVENAADSKVTVQVVSGGVILVRSEELGVTSDVAIYTVAGTKVWTGKVNGTEYVALAPGLYIVDNQKIIIR